MCRGERARQSRVWTSSLFPSPPTCSNTSESSLCQLRPAAEAHAAARACTEPAEADMGSSLSPAALGLMQAFRVQEVSHC